LKTQLHNIQPDWEYPKGNPQKKEAGDRKGTGQAPTARAIVAWGIAPGKPIGYSGKG
jgi:hypothetical protein